MKTNTQQDLIDPQNKESYITELIRENKLLLEKLNFLQEEIENNKIYSDKSTEYDENNIVVTNHIYSELIENIKLRAQVNQQKQALKVEGQNRISSRLGEELIKSVSSLGKILKLPFKLIRIWIALERTTPPSALGGVNFDKIVNAYAIGKMEAVEKLLNSVFISSVMRANAYTTLARKIISSDVKQAAILARMAWETDPRPYRLKWLAFRLHDAGDAINAEAILNMLPLDINLTDSEKAHIKRIKKDTIYECDQKIKNIVNISQQVLENQKKLIHDLKQTIEKEVTKNVSLNNKIKKLNIDHELEINNINKKIIDEKANSENLREELNKLNKQYMIELNNLKNKINEQQIITEKEHKELINAYEIQKSQLHQIEVLKKSFDDINIRTANILKILLNKFDQDPHMLSQIIQIVLN